MPRPIEIFRAGNHVSSDGTAWSFPAEVVQQMVESYDPAVFAAPLVVGHPTLDAPSYGQAATLKLQGDIVLMEPAHVEPQFATMVNDKRFPNVSASFFTPDHPSNPKPGQWYLRHVGFLGAAAPAIPGLKPASFAGTDEGVVTIDFAASVSTQTLTQTQQENTMPDKKDDQQTADFAAAQAELTQKAAELAAREKALADKEAAAHKAEVASFAASLVEKGQLLPAEQASIEAVLASLPAANEVSFAAADGTQTKQPTAQVLRQFLTGLPSRVNYGEHSAADNTTAQHASFAAPAGYSVDSGRMDLHNRILAYQQQHNVDYATAATAVGA
ncbi:MAG: hypothetical protein RL217_65 [Pseudomonadota bacterium]|jgi:murein DD-endopeptidase MepM/ murein hydrolase activator NlpD